MCPLLHAASALSDILIHAVSYMRSYAVYLENDDLVFSEGTTIKVRWSPVSVFPMELPDAYNVDIELMEMNMISGTWSKVISLASDIPNSGIADVVMPSVEEREAIEESVSPVVIRVSIGNNTINQASRKRSVSSLLSKLGQFSLVPKVISPLRYLRHLSVAVVSIQAAQHFGCQRWHAQQPQNIGQTVLDRLPPCPRRTRDIVRNSGFAEEKLSSLSPVIGTIQTNLGDLDLPVVGRVGDHIGYTIIDDLYRGFFHPGTTSCFRQKLPSASIQ